MDFGPGHHLGGGSNLVTLPGLSLPQVTAGTKIHPKNNFILKIIKNCDFGQYFNMLCPYEYNKTVWDEVRKPD